MKKMILGTLVCVVMTVSATAQVQDSTKVRRINKGECQRVERAEGNRMARPIDGKNRPVKLSAEQIAERKAKFLTEKLSLTAEQSQQLNQILIKEAKSLETSKADLKAKSDALRKERIETFRALRSNTETEIKDVLTEEQFAQLEKMSANHRKHAVQGKGQHGKHRGKPHKGQRPPQRGHRPHPQGRPTPQTEA